MNKKNQEILKEMEKRRATPKEQAQTMREESHRDEEKKNPLFLQHQKEVDLFSAINSCTEEPTISTETIANIIKKVYDYTDRKILRNYLDIIEEEIPLDQPEVDEQIKEEK